MAKGAKHMAEGTKRLAEGTKRLAGGTPFASSKELKYEADTDLEGVAVAVIEDALAVVEIVLPLNPQVGGVVKIPIECRPGGEGLGAVILVMEIGLPKNCSVGSECLKVVANIERGMRFKGLV